MAEVSTGYTLPSKSNLHYKRSYADTLISDIRALALSCESQSAQMSEIKNVG